MAVPQDPLAAAVHHRATGEQHHRGLVGRRLRGQLLDRVERRTEPAGVQRRPDDVLVAPHDALGVASGASRVEHVVVVGAAAAEPLGRGGGQCRVVLLAEHQHVPQARHGERPYRVHVFRRHDGGHAVGVGVEVGELVVQVLVVDVDGDRSRLQAAVEGVHPLDPVCRVHGHVLAGLDAERHQVVGQPRRSFVDLREGVVPVHRDDGEPVGYGVGHRLEDVGEVYRA
jgi:hypothetical protein